MMGYDDDYDVMNLECIARTGAVLGMEGRWWLGWDVSRDCEKGVVAPINFIILTRK